MSEAETAKKPRNKFTDVMKAMAAATAGGISSIGVGPIILLGSGLAVATAIATISIKMSNQKTLKKGSKKKGSMITDIQEECINRFRYNVWSPLSLSKMKIQGHEIVSTRYLINEDKIVLQVEWKEENSSASTKEEIILFDSLRRTKVKNNPKAAEQVVNAKLEQGGGRDEDREKNEESTMEENQKRREGFDEDVDEETGEEGNALIPKKMGTAKTSAVQKTNYDMRIHIWVVLVMVVVLILLLSPNLIIQ